MNPSCVLTPEQVEGPYFIDTGFERIDITEGSAGIPLRVQLGVVDVSGCAPMEGAVVELWHADASGAYSGFDESQGNLSDQTEETFLRGYQTTGANGMVEFQTVYPGWYPGRTPHFHVLALMGDNRLVATQLYFDDALIDRVYQQEPYAARGARDTTNADDDVSRIGGASGTGPLLLDVVEGDPGDVGSFVLGVGSFPD